MKPKSEAAETKAFKLSDRLTVEFTIGPADFTAEWEPGIPEKFTTEEAVAYKAARHEMLERLSARLGAVVVCVV